MTDDQPSATQHIAQRVLGDRYVLLGELGRGGMGVVWRAEDKVIGRQVAIKELRLPESGEGAAVFQERVLREVRTAGRLNDPAVVTVYDVINTDDGTYIVMELVEAPTLSDLVRASGPMTPSQVATIGEQVLSALHSAHQAGIVHRDVKPGNIMVAANGRVKLTDFGIAQATDDPRLTTSGFLVGSPAFMSPERVAGKDAVPASDIWSLGVTLYFAAEGKVAFERATTAATLHAIMNEVPYLTRTQGPLAAAIMGMLVSTPEARIGVEQAHGLLQMARAGGDATTPVQGVPATVYAAQAPKTGRRKVWLIGGAVAAVALLVLGALFGAWVASPSASQREDTWTYGAGGDLPEFTLSANGCASVKLDKGASVTETASCDDLHYIEVFTSDDVGMSDTDPKPSYPDSDLLEREVESWCDLVFNSSIVDPGKRDALHYRALVPTEAAWNAKTDTSDGDRTGYCVAFDPDGKQVKGPLLKGDT